jgi:hypothetical protein
VFIRGFLGKKGEVVTVGTGRLQVLMLRGVELGERAERVADKERSAIVQAAEIVEDLGNVALAVVAGLTWRRTNLISAGSRLHR